ncbi:MAG: hypothetical protein HRT40_08310 [Campylobacteraceae bacterium]|nr:hypothetical protein [Campylobacteraceae bacterium]
MKILLIFILFYSFLNAEVEFKSSIAIDAQMFSSNKSSVNKTSSNITFEQKLSLKKSFNDSFYFVEFYAQEDLSDFTSKKDNKRSYLRLNELYYQKDFPNDKILFGKSIRFWGSLEAKNITDVFNQQDLRIKPSKTDKKGAYNIEYTHYYDDSEISIIVKIHEENNDMASSSYYYNNLPLKYSKKLKSKSNKNRASIYLKYTGSLSEDIYLDYSFIYLNGFDSQRYLSIENNTFSQNIYLVNKFINYYTLVSDSTLYKLEFVYTDILNDKKISNYIHTALGLEHSLEAFDNSSELSLLAEYYYFKNLENNKLGDKNLGKVFQNDLFLALRYKLNDFRDSTFLLGTLIDSEYSEQSYSLEYESSLIDSLKLKINLDYINALKNTNTVYSSFSNSKTISFNLSYHF